MAGGRQLRKGEQPTNTGKVAAPAPKVGSATKGKWKTSTVAGGQLDRLSIARYLPPPEAAYVRPTLTTVNGAVVQEIIPNPREKERVCFVPFLIRGLGFQFTHSFLVSSISTASRSIIFPPTPSSTWRVLSPYARLSSAAGRTSACDANSFASGCRRTSMRRANAAVPISARLPGSITWKAILLGRIKTGKRNDSTLPTCHSKILLGLASSRPSRRLLRRSDIPGGRRAVRSRSFHRLLGWPRR